MSVGGSMMQQIGLVTVTAGKTGFITGMYVIFVPIVEYLFPCFHTTLSFTSVVATFVSLAGVYLLSGCAEQETCFGGAIKEGEVIVFISMFFWVGSIVFADLASKQLDGVWLTMVEFSLTAVVTIFAALYFEPSEWTFPFVSAQNNWGMIVLVGITEALAFALSTVGQAYSSPTRAALLYSLEAVVCAFCAYFFLGETLTLIECFGGFLMFLAAVCTSTAVVSNDEEEMEASNLELRSTDDVRKPIMTQHSGFGSLEMTINHPSV
jgi:drug/metabolite transporter (DMT)-like permease